MPSSEASYGRSSPQSRPGAAPSHLTIDIQFFWGACVCALRGLDPNASRVLITRMCMLGMKLCVISLPCSLCTRSGSSETVLHAYTAHLGLLTVPFRVVEGACASNGVRTCVSPLSEVHRAAPDACVRSLMSRNYAYTTFYRSCNIYPQLRALSCPADCSRGVESRHIKRACRDSSRMVTPALYTTVCKSSEHH